MVKNIEKVQGTLQARGEVREPGVFKIVKETKKCPSVSEQSNALSYGSVYQAHQLDDVKNRLQISSSDSLEESETPDPVIARMRIKDEIKDPFHCMVRVGLTLSDGSHRACRFVTPSYLEEMLRHQAHVYDHATVYLPKIYPELIELTLAEITEHGELIKVTRELRGYRNYPRT